MERLNEIQSKMYQEFMKQKGEKPYVFNNEEYGYGMSIEQIDKWNLGTGEIKIYSRRDKKDIFVPIFYAVEYRFDNMDEN